ncbi:hypothetical protein ACT1U9_32920 (plasmid) [Streptomyces sp. BR1]|uniref:hypothetical protein n=1 Tax=Streptomyces sp. BR1 TaxID=1592323 RepID=UPI00402B4688
MALLKRVDWHDNEIPYDEAEQVRYRARVARVRKEVAEIRSAIAGMSAVGDAFHAEITDFLTSEARMLESANEADGGVELRMEDDTTERRDWGPTSARRALLIARAWNLDHQDKAPGRG